jgi:aquaporin Z
MFAIISTGHWVAFGAALAIAVLLGGAISGGAYNPAVAISLYAAGKLPKSDVMPYVIVEILGALAAFYAYKTFVNKA